MASQFESGKDTSWDIGQVRRVYFELLCFHQSKREDNSINTKTMHFGCLWQCHWLTLKLQSKVTFHLPLARTPHSPVQLLMLPKVPSFDAHSMMMLTTFHICSFDYCWNPVLSHGICHLCFAGIPLNQQKIVLQLPWESQTLMTEPPGDSQKAAWNAAVV